MVELAKKDLLWNRFTINIRILKATHKKLSMHILKVTIVKSRVTSELFDENLKSLDLAEFVDIPSLNFYIQTFPKRYNDSKILLIIYNKDECRMKLIMSTSDNSLFVWLNRHNGILPLSKPFSRHWHSFLLLQQLLYKYDISDNQPNSDFLYIPIHTSIWHTYISIF